MRHFRPYLCGRAFEIVTDHRPLAGAKTLKAGSDSTGMRERWSIELSLYEFNIKYRPGRLNQNADALSRICDHVNMVKQDEPYIEKKT